MRLGIGKRAASVWQVQEVVRASSFTEYNTAFVTRDIHKYYRQRHQLFSLYDNGILMDRESWYSVTPEEIAIHHSQKLKCQVIIDGFSGCGGNTIQFARTCGRVISIEMDPIKVHLARNNAAIYGVSDKITFITRDYFDVLAHFHDQFPDVGTVDRIFLAPPWGGPDYLEGEYDVSLMVDGIGLEKILEQTRAVSSRVAVVVPRNTPKESLIQCGQAVGVQDCQIEENHLSHKLKFFTVYYE